MGLNGLTYVRGDALNLPFMGRTFDLALPITTLELVADPLRAVTEAVRVARLGLILGVLNRWSLTARRYRTSGKPTWQSARFFSPFGLTSLVRDAAGPRLRDIRWRTTLWPLPLVRDLPLPWGGFIGLGATLAEGGRDEDVLVSPRDVP